ncbi:MAG: DUF4837 family protein [Ignavibacteriales bacterium]|nr:DUF4837 family protein [Ignavibacteriales bacterium]
MKNFLLILFSSSLIFFAACDMTNKPAKGLEDEIYIVADSLEYEELRVALESTFEKVIYTPQPEKLFTLKRVSPGELEKYQTKKNIVIVAPMNSNSVASQFIKAIVDTAVQSKILSNQMSQVMKYNLWAKNQLVVVLTAPDMQELEFNILKKVMIFYMHFKKFPMKGFPKVCTALATKRKKLRGNFLKSMAGLSMFKQTLA